MSLAVATRASILAKVSTPVPASAVLRTACHTLAMFSGVTPVTPIRFSWAMKVARTASSGVTAVLARAATSITASVASARACSSLVSLTAEDALSEVTFCSKLVCAPLLTLVTPRAA